MNDCLKCLPKNFNFDDEIKKRLANVKTLQASSGLFMASAPDVKTGYNKAWLRDNYFMTLGFQVCEEWEPARDAGKALLKVLCKHQDKIKWAIENEPQEAWQYIHARYNPVTLEEYHEPWGNKQNDAVGEVLHLLAACECSPLGVLETDRERDMVQLLVDYLQNIKYWEAPDSGIWEEKEEIHASSIGACVAGLQAAQELSYVTVPEDLISKGQEALQALLPRESESKFSDLALLSLQYPFHALDQKVCHEMVSNIEYYNLRDRGVIRYRGDHYHNKNADETSEEAEWTMGLPWLAIIYAELGDLEKAEHYLVRTLAAQDKEGYLPELYYSHTDQPNKNSPLGWAESLFAVALKKVKDLKKANAH
ncbi:MAG: glycoside hydrolase family 15 protein [Candidatus Paceibacterota bacterium]